MNSFKHKIWFEADQAPTHHCRTYTPSSTYALQPLLPTWCTFSCVAVHTYMFKCYSCLLFAKISDLQLFFMMICSCVCIAHSVSVKGSFCLVELHCATTATRASHCLNCCSPFVLHTVVITTVIL